MNLSANNLLAKRESARSKFTLERADTSIMIVIIHISWLYYFYNKKCFYNSVVIGV